MRASERAWMALGVGIAVYEALAGDGELLSHQVDRWLESHPLLTYLVVTVTAAHLLNVLPSRVDPWHWAFSWRLRGA